MSIPEDFKPRTLADFPVTKKNVVAVTGGAIVILTELARCWRYDELLKNMLELVPALQSAGAQRIADERTRQLYIEGWDVAHDRGHDPNVLALAGMCYASMATAVDDVRDMLRTQMPYGGIWPWEPEWWKPGKDNTEPSRIRELEIAGALFAAEIDRMLSFGVEPHGRSQEAQNAAKFTGNPDSQADVRAFLEANPDREAADGGRLG